MNYPDTGRATFAEDLQASVNARREDASRRRTEERWRALQERIEYHKSVAAYERKMGQGDGFIRPAPTETSDDDLPF